MAQEECMSNIVKMQEQMIFLLAALTAGISCLTAIISSATVSIATANDWPLQQLDISNAYLNADLKETVYLRHPLQKKTPDGKPIFLALKKSLYGLPQSGYNWANQLHRHLKSGGFKQCTADTCMFRLKTTRGELDPNCPPTERNSCEEITVGSYVDDLCYSGSSDFIMKWL